MFLHKQIVLCCTAFWALLFAIPDVLQGQNITRFTGTYQIEGYAGEADFWYQARENDTILNGPFRMRRADLNPLMHNGENYFSFSGQFDENVPNGFWQFEFADITAGADPVFSDYQYIVKVNGTLHEASGRMTDGELQGKWVHEVKKLNGSKADTILFNSVFTFEKGIPQQSFEVENDQMTVLGRFLRNGLAHDVWELYSGESLEPTESWYFSEGRLERITTVEDNQTSSLEIYGTAIQNPATITLEERYFKILKLKQKLDHPDEEAPASNIALLLTENAAYYRKIYRVLSALGDSVEMPAYKVKVAFYPLKDAEAAYLDSIEVNLEKAAIISRTLLENTQLQIMKLSDEETLYLLSAVQAMQQIFQAPLRQLLTYNDEEVLEYVPRQELLQAIWKDKFPVASFEVVYEANGDTVSRTYSSPDTVGFTFEAYNLLHTHEVAQFTRQTMEAIEEALNEKLVTRERLQELEVLEENLLAEISQLKDLTDSLTSSVSGPPAEAVEQVKATADDYLRRYAALEDVRKKIDQAKLLITCFEQMSALEISISRIPEREDSIRQTYTDRVWNPFTSTLMDEKVKKRITSAYENVLVPYFLEQVNTRLTCDNVHNLTLLMEAAFRRTLQMREEDTSKTERKLKRERDPQEVMQLFDIPSYIKNIDP